jgi:parallel beta-helix repeat protein
MCRIEVYVDGESILTEGVGEILDGYCTFSVTEGTHTIEIHDNSRYAAITRNFEGTYTWDSMPDNWCKGNAAVKFKGVIVKDSSTSSFFNYKIKINDVLTDPSDVLNPGDEIWVWAVNGGSSQVDSVGIDDHVEVYGTYDGELHREVKLETGEHYLKEGSQEPGIVYVDDDFIDDPPNHKWNTIQKGINDANDGDRVVVYNGAYYENVVVNKSINLTGIDHPIVNGTKKLGNSIAIIADRCVINGFFITGSRTDWSDLHAGIKVESADNILEDNIVTGNMYGIVLAGSKNTVMNNEVYSNKYLGIHLYATPSSFSSNNTITRNKISDNGIGIHLGGSSKNIVTENNIFLNTEGIYLWGSGNLFYHNNFEDNYKNARDQPVGTNLWDNGAEGNYWSDYKVKYPEAKDKDGNGIWDTPYDIPGGADAKDEYPLVESRDETEVSGVLISNYPNLFKTNSYLVVGENAASIDMIGGIKLINELAYTGSSIVPLLDSEASGDTAHNILAVGGPMANSVTSDLNNDMGIGLSSDATKYTISISGWKTFDVPKSWEGSEDLAVVAVREIDGKNKLVIWGITGQGTWAACDYISEPDIRSQLKANTAIIHWKDVDGDTYVSPDDIVELYDSNSADSNSANGYFAANSLQLLNSESNLFSRSSSQIIHKGEKVLIIVGKESKGADHKGTTVLSHKLGENKLRCSCKVDEFLLSLKTSTITLRNFWYKHKLIISVGGPIPNKYTDRMNKLKGVTWEQNGNIFKITIDGKTFATDTSENMDDIAIIYRTVAVGGFVELTRDVIVVWGSKRYGTEKACEYLADLDLNSIDKIILKIDDGSINPNYVVSREFEMKALISESIYRYYSFDKDKNDVWRYFSNKFTPLNIAFETLCEITGLGIFSDLGSMAKDLGYSDRLSEYNQDIATLSFIYVDVEEYGFSFRSFKDNLKKIAESYNEGKNPDKNLLIDIYTDLENINEVTNTKYENALRIKRFNKLAMTFIGQELGG